jgi:hypothetical protein
METFLLTFEEDFVEKQILSFKKNLGELDWTLK